MSLGNVEGRTDTYGKIKSNNMKLELSKMFLDDYYISLVRSLDSMKPQSEEYKRTYIRVFILANLVQNDDYWYNVRDFLEVLKIPLDTWEGEKGRKYIGTFLYRMYKRGFLKRRLYMKGKGVGYEYQVKMERVRNPEVFFYLSYRDLIKEKLI